MFNVTLLFTDGGAKRIQIDKEMLIELVENINVKGSEFVLTNKGHYEVNGVVIGEVKGKMLIL
ncbi:TPA: hypothetical protein ACG1DY_005112 [Escherichia coli]